MCIDGAYMGRSTPTTAFNGAIWNFAYIQYRHIEHMYEGIYNFCLHRFYWNLLFIADVFLMPRSHIHGAPRRFYYGLKLTDDPGNANRYGCTIYAWLSTTTYDCGCNTESYGPIRIATNDAELYPWLIRRPVRECVTWASWSVDMQMNF